MQSLGLSFPCLGVGCCEPDWGWYFVSLGIVGAIWDGRRNSPLSRHHAFMCWPCECLYGSSLAYQQAQISWRNDLHSGHWCPTHNLSKSRHQTAVEWSSCVQSALAYSQSFQLDDEQSIGSPGKRRAPFHCAVFLCLWLLHLPHQDCSHQHQRARYQLQSRWRSVLLDPKHFLRHNQLLDLVRCAQLWSYSSYCLIYFYIDQCMLRVLR